MVYFTANSLLVGSPATMQHWSRPHFAPPPHPNAHHTMPVPVTPVFTPKSAQELRSAVDECVQPPKVGDFSSMHASSIIVRTLQYSGCRTISGQAKLEKVSGRKFRKLGENNCLCLQRIALRKLFTRKEMIKTKLHINTYMCHV